MLCRNGLDKFGYRDVLLLRQFLTPDGLIIGRRQTGGGVALVIDSLLLQVHVVVVLVQSTLHTL